MRYQQATTLSSTSLASSCAEYRPHIMFLLMILCCYTLSINVAQADMLANNQKNDTNQTVALSLKGENNALLNQAILEQDKHLRFNQIWMDQYQNSQRHKSGGAALGKIFRISVGHLYDRFRTNTKPIVINHHQNLNFENEPAIDYRLRVSNSKVKMKMEYKF